MLQVNGRGSGATCLSGGGKKTAEKIFLPLRPSSGGTKRLSAKKREHRDVKSTEWSASFFPSVQEAAREVVQEKGEGSRARLELPGPWQAWTLCDTEAGGIFSGLLLDRGRPLWQHPSHPHPPSLPHCPIPFPMTPEDLALDSVKPQGSPDTGKPERKPHRPWDHSPMILAGCMHRGKMLVCVSVCVCRLIPQHQSTD